MCPTWLRGKDYVLLLRPTGLFLQHGDRRMETVRFLLFLHGSAMHGRRTLLPLHLCHHFGGGLKPNIIVGPTDLTNYYLSQFNDDNNVH